jgi:DNA polymerase V
VSRSFGQTLTALQAINRALVSFVGQVGEKPRCQGVLPGQVMAFVTTNRFSANQPYYANSATVKLSYPTDFTQDLVEAATRLLETLYRPGFRYPEVRHDAAGLVPGDAGPGRSVRHAGPRP